MNLGRYGRKSVRKKTKKIRRKSKRNKSMIMRRGGTIGPGTSAPRMSAPRMSTPTSISTSTPTSTPSGPISAIVGSTRKWTVPYERSKKII
jgi:hypothetical protein